MNFYVIEMQTNSDGTSGFNQFGFADKGEAEDKFHATCISARQSTVMIHTVLFINNRGEHKEKPAVYVHPVEQNEQA